MPDPNCQIRGCMHGPGFVIECGYDAELGKTSVGAGWGDLVDWAFKMLPDGVLIVQVKTKFGELRIYTDPADGDYQRNILGKLTAAALATCSSCGAPAKYNVKRYAVTCADCSRSGEASSSTGQPLE